MKDDYCDLMCRYAEIPAATDIDGSGSCRTFIALYCSLKKKLVNKNSPCRDKVLREEFAD